MFASHVTMVDNAVPLSISDKFFWRHIPSLVLQMTLGILKGQQGCHEH